MKLNEEQKVRIRAIWASHGTALLDQLLDDVLNLATESGIADHIEDTDESIETLMAGERMIWDCISEETKAMGTEE